ncbi:MAG TPA: GNAT family N-acetyltransferase [Polyangia bacterium]|nr:GNAT family N-acetyltransferase [Polyangia bacterium]
MRWEILRDGDALAACYGEWHALWQTSPSRPLTLHPAWVEAWWRSLGGDGELLVVLCREGELRGVAPFYVRPPRGGALRVRELGLLGDGVVGASAALLARPEDEPAVAAAVAGALEAERGWDLLEMTLLEQSGEGGADLLAELLAERGWTAERATVQGHSEVILPVALPPRTTGHQPVMCDPARQPTTVRLVAELASRGEVRQSGEPAFVDFLERVVPSLVAENLAELWLVEAEGRPAAGQLILIDGERRVELLRGVASGWVRAGETLMRWALNRAMDRGARRFEISTEPPPGQPMPTRRVRGLRLRIFATTATGRLHARYASIERRAGVVADAARDEIDRLRGATQDVVERVVARVATFARLHLYRGELFISGAPPPPGLELRLFTLEDYKALADPGAFLRRLDLEEHYCLQKWERGDVVVVAELEDQPVGIVWCARQPVFVPEIGREVRPLGSECYIHDVFVTPSARGRAVAPAMLEYLARELRSRDIYRAWALIERSNTSSTRAFEKASYASIADVIYARMGLASKLLVRPPDPEARAFLGLH